MPCSSITPCAPMSEREAKTDELGGPALLAGQRPALLAHGVAGGSGQAGARARRVVRPRHDRRLERARRAEPRYGEDRLDPRRIEALGQAARSGLVEVGALERDERDGASRGAALERAPQLEQPAGVGRAGGRPAPPRPVAVGHDDDLALGGGGSRPAPDHVGQPAVAHLEAIDARLEAARGEGLGHELGRGRAWPAATALRGLRARPGDLLGVGQRARGVEQLVGRKPTRKRRRAALDREHGDENGEQGGHEGGAIDARLDHRAKPISRPASPASRPTYNLRRREITSRRSPRASSSSTTRNRSRSFWLTPCARRGTTSFPPATARRRWNASTRAPST